MLLGSGSLLSQPTKPKAMRISPTAHTHRGLVAIVAVMAMLWLAGCGSSGKAPSADAPAGNETPASSNAAGSSDPKPTGTATKTKHTVHEEVLAARQGVITMTKCVEGYGVKVPPQNLQAAKPVFSVKGIDTETQQFHTAYTACLGKAIGAYKTALQKKD
jgi:hypothetical protein